jgi:hypothetical protein
MIVPMRRLAKRAVDIWTSDPWTGYSWEDFLDHIIKVWKLGSRAAEFRRTVEDEVGHAD